MVKGVIPELSCPVALFTYYNPILKRGIPKFMSIVKEAGVHGNIYIYIYLINHIIFVMFSPVKIPLLANTYYIN